jgi:hypothetical protein
MCMDCGLEWGAVTGAMTIEILGGGQRHRTFKAHKRFH